MDPRTRLGTKSGFLFGPRATGKTTLLRNQLPQARYFDLLDSDVYRSLLRRPRKLGEDLEELSAEQRKDWIIIDEIQKIPALLDEVHRLIENQKLKRGGANLLAGRARVLDLFPLVSREIPKFNLERYLSFGGLPPVYGSDDPMADLHSYVGSYLKEEIQAEAIVRRIDH